MYYCVVRVGIGIGVDGGGEYVSSRPVRQWSVRPPPPWGGDGGGPHPGGPRRRARDAALLPVGPPYAAGQLPWRPGTTCLRGWGGGLLVLRGLERNLDIPNEMRF